MMADVHREPGQVQGSTLLVASKELLLAWSERASHPNTVVAIGDTDLTHVIEMIHAKHPAEVVLEETLAVSPRGAPLMTALRQEQRRHGLTIRLLSPERVTALVSSHPGYADPQIWLTAFAHPLPPRPRQRAARVPLNVKDAALVDGHAATLVDLSPLGAQVQSDHILRPHQQVRVVLASHTHPVVVTATIVWSALELTPAPRYRAGLAFSAPVPRDIGFFLASAALNKE